MVRSPRYRNYIFTHNNYVDTVLEDTIECKYIAYGFEVAPTTGTPHLQGFICFPNAVTYQSVIDRMPGCNVQHMKGSLAQNDAYCSKEGTLVKRGEAPLLNEDRSAINKLRWFDSLELAKADRIDEIEPELLIRNYPTWKAIRMDYMIAPKDLEGRKHCGIWIWGESGLGKTGLVKEVFPDCYIKRLDAQWNGYQLQDVVYLDEVSPKHEKWGLADHLKHWAGWACFNANVKYGARMLRPKLFIVTSNYSINEMGFHETDIGPLKNRFTEYNIKVKMDPMLKLFLESIIY